MTGRSKKYQNDPMEESEINETETNDQENDIADGDIPADKSEETEKFSDEVSYGTAELIGLKEKVAKLEREAYDFRDKLMRKAAEFENYRKRTSEEFVKLIDTANEDLIVSLLPVLDDIERFRKNYSSESRTEDMRKGVDMILDKLGTALKSFGLEEMDSIGQEFNPDYHDALMMMEKQGAGSNIVIDQHAKGYKLKNKVIRHAKVVVSK